MHKLLDAHFDMHRCKFCGRYWYAERGQKCWCPYGCVDDERTDPPSEPESEVE